MGVFRAALVPVLVFACAWKSAALSSPASNKLACTYTVRRVEAWYRSKCMHVTDKSLNFANAVTEALYTCKHAVSRSDGVRIANEFLKTQSLHAELCPGVLNVMRHMQRREQVHARWTERERRA